MDLIGRSVSLNKNVGIFVTMNPGYAGRSNLPDNLKQLFRPIAMVKPDWELIAQVMLFSQGFQTAERLAGRAVRVCLRMCVGVGVWSRVAVMPCKRYPDNGTLTSFCSSFMLFCLDCCY